MKHLLFLPLLFLAVLNVSAIELGEAKLSTFTQIKDGKVICEVPAGSAKGIHGALFTVDLKPFRNRYIVWEVMGRGDNISKPPERHFGQKFILTYTTPDGKLHYAESNGRYGSFGNTKLAFGAMIEPDAETGFLRFGMQHVSGRMEYDLNTFKVSTKFTKQNAGHICEYSDAVKNRPLRRGVMSPITDQTNEENFKVLRDWNVNLMRLQLNTSETIARDPLRYQKFIDEKIENVIPEVLELGRKYGIAIIIDLHTVPGTANSRNDPCLFDDEERVRLFIRIWERIAAKFKGHPALYGYDLINEPNEQRPVRFGYWEVQRLAAEAIRKTDPETPIFIESNHLCSPYTYPYLSPLKLKNIIYQFHSYDPFVYTHTRFTEKDRKAGKTIPPYPGKFLGANWNFESMKARLRHVREFQRKHQAKIYVGEFSARACAPGAERYLEDSIRIFEESGWDWTYHAFRESKIWSLEYAGATDDTLTPSNDNPRKRVLLNAFRRNRSDAASGGATSLP